MRMDDRKAFWRLAGPSAAEGLLLMLLAAVDLLMVSSLGTIAVAAVSIFGQPRMVILCVSRSFSVAITAHIAQRCGEKKQNSFTEFARQSLFLSAVGGIFLCSISIYFCKPILLMAGAETEYLYQATQYAIPALLGLALSAPAITLHGILAGIGDTKTVLTTNIFGNVINILCNAILIFGIGPFPQLGVLGAGIGTLIGTAATLVATLMVFMKKEHVATLWGKGSWLPRRLYLKQIFPLSSGVFAEQAVERVGMFLYSRMVAELGASSLGVHNICMGICDIYYSFSQGMGKASLIQAGNDCGATRGKHLRNIQRISRGESIWTASASCMVLICLRNVILKLYHLEGTELVLGLDIMILVALVSFPEAQAMTHAGILRGIGRTGYVAKYSLISIAILRPIVTYLLTYPFGMKLYGAWIALLLDQTIRAVFSVIGSIYYTEQLAKLK